MILNFKEFFYYILKWLILLWPCGKLVPQPGVQTHAMETRSLATGPPEKLNLIFTANPHPSHPAGNSRSLTQEANCTQLTQFYQLQNGIPLGLYHFSTGAAHPCSGWRHRKLKMPARPGFRGPGLWAGLGKPTSFPALSEMLVPLTIPQARKSSQPHSP